MSSEEKLVGQAQASAESKRSKFLVFTLYGERYAVPLNQVKEVIGMADITGIPHVPAFFKGLINLRGKIISVIDLRQKLELKKDNKTEEKNCIIISELSDTLMGVIVDDVIAVVGHEESEIEKDVNIQSKVSREYILGVAKAKDVPLTLLLDLTRLLDVSEFQMLKKESENHKK